MFESVILDLTMRTESGALSIGAPNSDARFVAEATHAMGVQYQCLLLTDEGRQLLSRFAKSVGCDFSRMDNLQASNFIDSEYKALFSFLCGVTFLSHKSQ
jgi:hypothetical protein